MSTPKSNDSLGRPTNGNAFETLREELKNTGGGAEPPPPTGETDQDRLLRESDELLKDFD